jgi:hypothetical protein
MHVHKERPEWGSVYDQNEAMKDVFARGLKKMAVQVCALTIIYCRMVSTCIHVHDSLCSTIQYSVICFTIPASRRSDS